MAVAMMKIVITKFLFMKKLKKFSAILLSLFVTGVFLTSCNDDDNSNPADGSARIIVHLTDAPGDYSEVHVNVKDVMVKANDDGDDENGWVSLESIEPGDYDLLQLTGGQMVMIAEGDVPAGNIHQIRLVLEDEGNYLVTSEGEEPILSTPSAQQSGLKLKLDQELSGGFVYNFILDFDVDKSIVEAGNSGNYNLKPVMRISAEVSSGIVTGVVTNPDVQVLASIAISETESVSAYTDENGVFKLYGVPAGTYDLVLTAPEDSGLEDSVLESVEVVNGEITDVGEITLEAITTGSVSGTVLNEGVAATISVMVSEEVTLSTTTAEDGTFMLGDIPAGTYDVLITPAEGSGLGATTIADVTVNVAENTNLGDITLE